MTKIENTNVWEQLSNSFKIFSSYSEKGEYWTHVSACDDVIYAGPNPKKVTVEDLNLLESMGWSVSNKLECFVFHT